jgi:UDP-N-acetylmuramate: L-alanyl-gamma-D-glutamyl-meso-diaminopimelate ligase
MRIHILGICGTFMGGLAQILKESGHNISGSDTQFYPPMSDYLASLGVDMIKGYAKDTLPKADLYVIGNALSRGNECVELILDSKLPFKSGPQMLGEILEKKTVFAVSGTHGKTTTSYMLAHIFLDQGKDIGFLVGGISDDISGSASLGTDKIFVIEADEYDSAFFDKRSKFIHYAPSTLIINNIEFDHADIFDDLKDIKKQFHHLLKTIPPSGNIIYFSDDINAQEVINMGNWSQLIKINDCEIKINFDLKEIKLLEKTFSLKNLPLIGEHNFKNYICAILAARTGGVAVEDSIISLQKFNGVKRRLEFKGLHSNIKVYDDFAHHPTAIQASSKAIRNKFPEKKILGVIELASNTMSEGIHGISLVESPNLFDEVIWLDHKGVLGENDNIISVNKIEEYINKITEIIKEFDIVVCMTNKDSQKIIRPIIDFLNEK